MDKTETKTLTITIDKDSRVVLVEKQMKIVGFHFSNLEFARSWVNTVTKLKDHTWEISVLEAQDMIKKVSDV